MKEINTEQTLIPVLAGFWRRVVASWVDSIILVIFGYIFALIISFLIMIVTEWDRNAFLQFYGKALVKTLPGYGLLHRSGNNLSYDILSDDSGLLGIVK